MGAGLRVSVGVGVGVDCAGSPLVGVGSRVGTKVGMGTMIGLATEVLASLTARAIQLYLKSRTAILERIILNPSRLR